MKINHRWVKMRVKQLGQQGSKAARSQRMVFKFFCTSISFIQSRQTKYDTLGARCWTAH